MPPILNLRDNAAMDRLHIFGSSGAVGRFLLARLRVEQRVAIAYSHRSSVYAYIAGDTIQWRQLDLWRDADASSATTIISAGPLDAFTSWLARVDTPDLRRVVALSSMSVEAKRVSLDPYERDLAARLHGAEQHLRDTCSARSIEWTILRPTLIWGAARDRSLTSLYRFGRRYGFVPVPNTAGGLRQPVHAADVADACRSALSCPASAGTLISLGGGERLSAAEMWLRVAKAADARNLRVPHWLLRMGSNTLRPTLQRWHNDQVAECATAMTLPNWQPRSFLPMRADFVDPQ
ncbi:MAG: hypothetical protein SGI99_05200 [Pseudomonadota bacterium]|nr:hypothetical protein [Pseudomonadota bacterium]